MRSPTAIRILVTSLTLLTAAVTGCGKKTAKRVIPPLPKVEIADVPAPASAMVTVEKGMILHEIASEAYANYHMSGFVMALNGIPAPEWLQAGTTLKTPSLPVAFRDAGLHARYQPAINVLSKAWMDFAAVMPDYLKARGDHPDGGTFEVPKEVKTRLLQCADMIDAAIDALSHVEKDHGVPRNTIGQFSDASSSLRHLASGLIESRDYDIDLLEKAFGHGFTNALVWAQEHHK